jgi:hypothetical protein
VARSGTEYTRAQNSAPKKGAEEHHLREDEEAHPPAERHVFPAAVLAGLGLADHLAEPAHHHVEEQQEAGADSGPAAGRAVEEEHGADRHHEERAEPMIGQGIGCGTA